VFQSSGLDYFSVFSALQHISRLCQNQKVPASKVVALRNPMNMIKIFRERTVQCLVLSNYTNPTIYTVETLFLYYISERRPMLVFPSLLIIGLSLSFIYRHRITSSVLAKVFLKKGNQLMLYFSRLSILRYTIWSLDGSWFSCSSCATVGTSPR